MGLTKEEAEAMLDKLKKSGDTSASEIAELRREIAELKSEKAAKEPIIPKKKKQDEDDDENENDWTRW